MTPLGTAPLRYCSFLFPLLPLEGVKMVDPLWLLASPPPVTRFLPVLVDPVTSLLLEVSSILVTVVVAG